MSAKVHKTHKTIRTKNNKKCNQWQKQRQ